MKNQMIVVKKTKKQNQIKIKRVKTKIFIIGKKINLQEEKVEE